MNKLFKKSIKKYQKKQELFYKIQKISNESRAASKKAIALLRRENIKESKETIEKAEKFFKLINQIIKKEKDLIGQAAYKEAVEEYIEAVAFYNFLTKSKKEIPGFIKVGPEEVIFGVCDFTGELIRRAVTIASPETLNQLLVFRNAIRDIVEEMTKIGFSGKLRQKCDETERNLRKLEEIIYAIRLKK